MPHLTKFPEEGKQLLLIHNLAIGPLALEGDLPQQRHPLLRRRQACISQPVQPIKTVPRLF